MILGTINSVDSVNGLKVVIDGEDSPSTKKYSYISSYVPVANDRVMIEEINGSYVILGKLITEVSQSGIVRKADNATNATYASSADSATTATTATNATNATTAASCSGNAATATVSNTTKGFDSSFSNYTYGQLVTNVTREYDSTLGKYIVTNIQTSFAQNFTYK